MERAPAAHVIVCGSAGIATRIIQQLIDVGEEPVVLGEPRGNVGTLTDTLVAAGIHTARAIVCVTGNEVRNLELALLARELRADLRVVTQLSNQAVGHAMLAGNEPGAVLDVASLAAPAIVEASLGRRVHAIEVGGVEFVVASLPVPGSGTLRRHFGDLAPVAVVRRTADVTTVVPCPGRDIEVRFGERAAMLGTRADFAECDIELDDELGVADSGRSRRMHRLLATLKWLARDVDKGLYRAIFALVSLVMVSTVVLRLGYRIPEMSVLDALYFSVETVATVGYGDFSFVAQPPWLRAYAIFLMASGITCTAVLMAFLADLLISRRLGQAAGRRRARTMTGHVVVVGLGSFGIQVASALLTAGRQVVVIERSERNRFVGAAAVLGVPVVFGDATLRPTLDAARVSSAAAVAVMTSDDMTNIETALAVRDVLGERWNESRFPIVLRVFDRSLGLAVARRFRFGNVQATEEIAAPWFVGAALGLDVLNTFSIESQTFMVGRVTIDPDGGLAGVAMHELSAHTRVIALTRAATGAMEHPPRRGTRFEPGDLAYLVGPYRELLDVLGRARVSS